MIQINVTGQQASITSQDYMANYSVEIVGVSFTFDSSWAGFSKRALFRDSSSRGVSDTTTTYSVEIVENSCVVPWEVLEGTRWIMSVVGTKDSRRITTNMLTLSMEDSGYSESTEGQEPTPSEYEQLVTKIEAKVDPTQYASINQAGVIKLYATTTNGVLTNKSGIIVKDDGSAYIATRSGGGILRDGAGGLYVVSATAAEVAAGTASDRFITPSVFKAGVENIVKQIAYSTTPVQIGTWTDGTPVWRVALPYIQMQADSRHLVVDEEKQNIYVSLIELMEDYVDNTDNAQLLNININVESEVGLMHVHPPDDVCFGIIYFAKENKNLYEEYITYENGYWGGYIDFITAEKNIN
jgi:hypothetical protein